MSKYHSIAIAGALALAAPLAQAQVKAPFNVLTTVGNACFFSTNPSDLDFGTYNPADSAPLTATGSAVLTCALAANTPLWVWIKPDANTRRMIGVGEVFKLNYEIFTTPGGPTQFATERPGSSNYTYNNAPLTIQYYGSVPTQQYIRGGTYTQLATLNVSF